MLLEPGQLDADAWAIMKTLAALGAEAIARWHDGTWDGHGYPDGLAGDNIPVSALPSKWRHS